MNFTNVKNTLLCLSLSVLLMACDSSSSTPDTAKRGLSALAKITAYADDNKNPKPTLEDYQNAGITGVTTSNLASVNKSVDALEGNDVDTTSELQTVVIKVNAEKPTTKPTAVPDTTKPVITLLGNTSIELARNSSYSDAGATATDNIDGNISNNIVVINTVDSNKLGRYTVSYNVKDSARNAAIERTRIVKVINTAPTLTGIANPNTEIYTYYQFLPKAVDGNNDTLTFSIQNKPSWTSFNTATGLLEGSVSQGSEGIYADIIISVSDGIDTTSLAPFSIEVGSATDIAHKFGKAIQGTDSSYAYYSSASNVIDNDDSTYNHTSGGKSAQNWLQIELPNPTKISKVVIQNRGGNTSRLNGAKVYLSNTSYVGSVIASELIQTLTATDNEQIVDLTASPKSGRYLIIKGETTADDNRHLHLKKVEVYGETPVTPIFPKDQYTLGLKSHASISEIVGAVEAIDYQSDTLAYSIIGDVPFSVNEKGEIILSQLVNHNAVQQYDFKVEASDGVNKTQSNVTVKLLNGSGVKLERWNGISGGSISNLTESKHFKEDPADSVKIIENIDDYEATVGGNDYGQRLTTLIKPKESGNYIFNLVADKRAQLWLSTDDKNANLEKIAEASWHSATHKAWNDSHAQQSNPIYLEQGNVYAIKVLHKDGGDPNFVAVAWKKETQSDYTLVPSDVLFLGSLDSSNVTPTFDDHDSETIIQGSTKNGTVIAVTHASDAQNDSLTYSIVGDLPFSVDSEGNITVSGALTASVYTIEVQISDGTNVTTTTVTVNVTPEDVIEKVLASGDVINTPITEEELIQATLDEIEVTKTFLQDAKVQIFNLNEDGSAKADGSSLTAIDWDPSHDSAMLKATIGKNTALLYTNARAYGGDVFKQELGIIGKEGQGRYLVLGGNPFRTTGKDNSNYLNDEMHTFLNNSLSWLTGRDDLNKAPFSVVIAHLAQSHWFEAESKTREWLDKNYAGNVNYNDENACDNTALAGCLAASPDLLIISQVSVETDNVEEIARTVENALRNGTDVLYVHYNDVITSLGRELFSKVFDVTREGSNSGNEYILRDYNPTVDMNVLAEELKQIKTVFTHFKNKDYDIDWSTCTDGKTFSEDFEKCNNVESFKSAFLNGAVAVKSQLDGFDKQKKNIFAEEGYRIQKLFALTADKFRQSVVFPMDKVRSNHTEVMKSFYADRAVYNYRNLNPKQPDLGNFSRSDFSHITPTTRVLNMLSKRKFSATGAYALPGQTVKVTRTDSSDVVVKVFVNSLRAGSTHQTAKYGYTRPRLLQSTHIEIKSGETIEFTSPYGGPLQLSFDTNDLPVTVTFENIGEHPYWGSVADDASFEAKMAAHEYDWAEVATAGFTVHSTHEKMLKSIADPKWDGTAAGLAAAIEKYTSNYPHVLAGFKGKGVDVVPEIHDWANTKGLTIETIDTMKHMNADQASCGGGCSGNPYDAYWAFNPIGHGDIHEMGHSMQKMRFEGFPNHAATNTFSFYTKSRYTANTSDTNNDCWKGMPFKTLYETIQSSVGNADVEGFLKTNLWDKAGLGEQYLLKIQAMMHAQKMGKVENGWHVLARVHILEREMRRAKQDWNAKKASVGFDRYSLDEINAIKNNDWLIIAYSYAAGLDYTNYFDMMGIPYTQKARDQIASFGFEVVPNALFKSESLAYCSSMNFLDQPLINVDGTTIWSTE